MAERTYRKETRKDQVTLVLGIERSFRAEDEVLGSKLRRQVQQLDAKRRKNGVTPGLGSVYSALRVLEKDGEVSSRPSRPLDPRRSKRLYRLTK